jgi:hypothetical protein
MRGLTFTTKLPTKIPNILLKKVSKFIQYIIMSPKKKKKKKKKKEETYSPIRLLEHLNPSAVPCNIHSGHT